MKDHLDFGEHLHEASFDDKFRKTFLGQGHLAGTGPDGATCRLCKFWGMKDKGGYLDWPGHYSFKDKDKGGQCKKGKCHYPIPHKANRRYPHHALACSLFEASDNPPPEIKEKPKPKD